jgi:hypothetical protein
VNSAVPGQTRLREAGVWRGSKLSLSSRTPHCLLVLDPLILLPSLLYQCPLPATADLMLGPRGPGLEEGRAGQGGLRVSET